MLAPERNRGARTRPPAAHRRRGVLLLLAVLTGEAGCHSIFPYLPGGDRPPDDGRAVDTSKPQPRDEAGREALPPTGPTFVWASSGEAEGWGLSFNHPVSTGTNRLLLVGVSIESASAETVSVTFAKTTLKRFAAPVESDQDGRDCNSSLWYLVDPPVLSGAVEVTIGGNISSPRSIAAWALSFTGVNQTVPLGGEKWAVGTPPDTELKVTVPSASGQLVVDHICVAADSLAPLLPGAGQIQRITQDTGSRLLRTAASTRPGAAQVLMSWQLTATASTLQAAALQSP